MRLFGKRTEKGRIAVEKAPPAPIFPPAPGVHRGPRQVVFEHGPGLLSPVYEYALRSISPFRSMAESDLSELSREGWDIVTITSFDGNYTALCRRPIVQEGEQA